MKNDPRAGGHAIGAMLAARTVGAPLPAGQVRGLPALTMATNTTPGGWVDWASSRGARRDVGDPLAAWLEDGAGTTWKLEARPMLAGAELAAWAELAACAWLELEAAAPVLELEATRPAPGGELAAAA